MKKGLKNLHPFVLVLYLTIVAVAAVLLFNAGKSIQESPVDSITQPLRFKDGATNAWELPPFQLEDTDGVLRSLSDWKGQVILLNFWATWCPPCKYEIPDFMEYQTAHEEEGFQIIGIGIDDAAAIREYYDAMGMNYPVLMATDSRMMSDWGNREQVLPYSVVIDRTGEIRYIHRGQLDPAVFDAEIKPLIQNP